ncbi:PDZ domain-containing protein [Candidatus Saccharibacteria bacterium]|nr:PDZ domain-containing protein [Candidatus Saccharibacteria bacterium]
MRAVDPVKLKEEQAKSEQPAADVAGDADQAHAQEGQTPGDRGQVERDRDGGLNRGTSPEFQPPNLYRRGFVLGVQVQYMETGARITRVIPSTPAWRFGLEPGDVVVAIDGFQIGYVKGRLYDLPSELHARARRTGWVRLLVQNVRNNQLLNLDVRLAGKSKSPRERELGFPLESEIDQAEVDGSEQVVPTRPSREP